MSKSQDGRNMQAASNSAAMDPLPRVSRDNNETTIDLYDVSFSGRLTCPVTSNNCEDW